jgi:DNA polymerase-3 subunit beta
VKFQAERDVFAGAVARAARVVPDRPVSPVLAGMRLAAQEDTLTVSAYDYETSSREAIGVDAGEPGSVLVPGRLLAEIARSLPSKPVRVDVDDARMTVACGSAKFSLALLPGGEYPELPEMPEAAGTAGTAAFAAAVARVAVAASRDDSLPALCGVRVEAAGDRLVLVATDRYRIAVGELPWAPARGIAGTAVLVPAKMLSGTAKSLAGEQVAIAVDDEAGIIGFESERRAATSRLLGGEYPRYRQLLPSEFSAVADLPAAPFAEAVGRVALVAEGDSPVVLTFSEDAVLVEAGSEAQASEMLEAGFDGDGLRAAFKPQYLLDGVSAAGTGTVRMSFTGTGRPTVITAAGHGEPDFRYVVMPVREA